MSYQNRKIRIIGWREWVKLPGIGIKHIKAKIDTGARSSSLHAYNIEFNERDGQQFVSFKVQPLQNNRIKVVEAELPVSEFRKVRSSNGETTNRPVVRTSVELFANKFEIDVTLFDRTKMGFRMLLGREAIQSRFVVDAARSYCGGKPKKKKANKN